MLYPYVRTPRQLLQNNINAELCNVVWCKAWELYQQFSDHILKINEDKEFSSLHLNESGSFVTSLNHFINNHYGTDVILDWKAVTNSKASSFINDTRECWMIVQTLNATAIQLVIDFVPEKVDLVTCDGSFDGMEFEEGAKSEFVTFCNIVIGIHTLVYGGCMIVQLLSLNTEKIAGVLQILSEAFENIHITKPIHSQPLSDEVYVVCCEFNGLSDALLDTLKKAALGLLNWNEALVPKDKLSIINELQRVSEILCKYQSDEIKQLRDYYSYMGFKELGAYRNNAVRKFIETSNIQQLDQLYHITSKFKNGSPLYKPKRKGSNTIQPHRSTVHHPSLNTPYLQTPTDQDAYPFNNPHNYAPPPHIPLPPPQGYYGYLPIYPRHVYPPYHVPPPPPQYTYPPPHIQQQSIFPPMMQLQGPYSSHPHAERGRGRGRGRM
jgi:23S rRNA U2552 (ribose-2'-O)-methylase RlmE/FtsJ